MATEQHVTDMKHAIKAFEEASPVPVKQLAESLKVCGIYTGA